MKVGIKVKKFGIGWCIPHRMAADNASAKGGPVRTPSPTRTWYRITKRVGPNKTVLVGKYLKN